MQKLWLKIKANKKSVLTFSFIFLCAFLLLFFFVLHSRSSKVTNVVTNPQSGWSSFTGAGNFITAITWDKDGNLWVAGEEFGVSIIDEKTIKTFDISYCYTILCDNSGKVWFGTIREGLYCYDNGVWRNYNTSDGLPSNSIHALAIDKDNNLYCASGLSLVKHSFGKWEKVQLPSTATLEGRSPNLPNSEISCIDFDNENNLWIGFSLGGVAKLDGKDWKLFTQKEGLDIDGRVNDILVAEDGTIWVATCSGIARSMPGTPARFDAKQAGGKDINFTVNKFEPFHKGYTEQEDPLGWSFYPANYFTSIAQYDSDNILFVNRHDPPRRWNNFDSRFMPFVSPGQLPLKQQHLSRNYFYCINVDKDGYVWVGSYGGGIITNNSSFKFPSKIIKTQIETKEETPPIDFLEQPEQKELIAKTYKLLKESDKNKPTKVSVAGEQAYYIGEDWLTQGNWIGNYGEYAWILPSYYAAYPIQNIFGGSDRLELERFKHIRWDAYIGENSTPDDSIRGWELEPGEIDYGEWENPRVSQDPLGGGRHNGAWDDHAEAYPGPLIREGPHIYLDLDFTEEGIFIVSFYFMNNDSHEGDPMNKFRDYVISVKKKTSSEKEFNYSSLLTSSRVHDFRAGVYKRFMLKGPGEYTIKFDKKESFNTMIWGIFVDKMEK